MSEFINSPKRINAIHTGLLVVDLQEKIMPVIRKADIVIENSLKLIKGFKQLNLPIFFTEQYPKGLGPIAQIILNELESIEPFQKMSFSCSGAEGLFGKFEEMKLKQIVVCGVESHVCVMQTVLDLYANGFLPYVTADAVSSRKKIDYIVALRRMINNGAEIITTESVLFELLNVCGNDDFKFISKLVK